MGNSRSQKIKRIKCVYETDADPGFGQGGSQPPRPKVADVAEQSHLSKVCYKYLQPGSRDPGGFGVLQRYSQSRRTERSLEVVPAGGSH